VVLSTASINKVKKYLLDMKSS